MTLLILPAVLAFLMVLFGMPSLIMVAKRKHLVDEPSESRKLHHRSVPTVGGVMIFAAVVCGALLSMTQLEASGAETMKWIGVLGLAIPTFFMGLKDDIMGMGAGKKLLVHVCVGLFLVLGLDCRIEGFDGLFGVYALPWVVSVPFSLFVYIVIVNAINLVDGIDGLAGGFGMVSMAAFAWWFDATGNVISTLMAMSMLGALAGFLVFNFHPAKIFMGDSGSLLIGLFCYVLAVGVIQTPDHPFVEGVSKPVAAMALLAFPLVDTLRVFFLRVIKGRSPFSPDRLHIHHHLMSLGWGHRLTSAAVWMYSLVFACLAFQPTSVWMGMGKTAQFALMLGLAFGLGAVPYFLVKTGKGRSVWTQEEGRSTPNATPTRRVA